MEETFGSCGFWRSTFHIKYTPLTFLSNFVNIHKCYRKKYTPNQLTFVSCNVGFKVVRNNFFKNR